MPSERPGQGIVFRRVKQSGGTQEIAAHVSNVVDTARCTVLGGSGGATISTVEHLLSALAGLGVTDCIVEVDGPEIPIGDGSALIWTEAIAGVGVVAIPGSDMASVAAGAKVAEAMLPAPVTLTGRGGSFIAAYPSDALRITVAVSYEQHTLVGTQIARFEPGCGDAYSRDIAPARTFGFIEEVEALRAAGLAQGGSFDNAVVVYPDRYSSPLRFEDELARHKLLDLIGDLALAGSLPVADIIAVKPSHRLNTAFAARLCAVFAS